MFLSARLRNANLLVSALAACLALHACFCARARAAESVPSVAVISHITGLNASDSAMTRGLNTILTFKLESAPGVRVVPDTEIDAAGNTVDTAGIWAASDKAVRRAADSLAADLLILGRHRTRNGTVAAEFKVCSAGGKVSCRTVAESASANNAAAMQKNITAAAAGAVNQGLAKEVRSMPFTGSGSALDAFFQGVDLLARGKSADAFKSLQKASAADAAFRDLWYFMGKYYASREFNYDKAISYLNKTITRYPKDPAAHFWLGFAYYLQGATMPAIRAFETTVSLKPAAYDAYAYLAMLNKDLGEYQKVENYYRRALEYTPGNAAAWYNLAGIQAQMNKPQDAVASLRRALTLNCGAFLDIARTDADFARIRKNAAFANLLQEFSKKCGKK